MVHSCSLVQLLPRSYLCPHVASTALSAAEHTDPVLFPPSPELCLRRLLHPPAATRPPPLPSFSINPLRGHPLSKTFLLFCSFPQSRCSSRPVHTLIILCHSPFLPPDIELQPETHQQDLLGTGHFAIH